MVKTFNKNDNQLMSIKIKQQRIQQNVYSLFT